MARVISAPIRRCQWNSALVPCQNRKERPFTVAAREREAYDAEMRAGLLNIAEFELDQQPSTAAPNTACAAAVRTVPFVH
jgi:hypothetical protein